MADMDALGRIIAALFGMVAAGFAASAVVLARQGQAVRSWPQTSGTILSASVVPVRDGPTTWYQVRVAYRYVVAGRPYRSTCIRRGHDGRTLQSSEAREWLARYPVGATVPVYYHPRRRWEAALEPVVATGSVAYRWSLAVLFGVVALSFLCF